MFILYLVMFLITFVFLSLFVMLECSYIYISKKMYFKRMFYVCLFSTLWPATFFIIGALGLVTFFNMIKEELKGKKDE